MSLPMQTPSMQTMSSEHSFDSLDLTANVGSCPALEFRIGVVFPPKARDSSWNDGNLGGIFRIWEVSRLSMQIGIQRGGERQGNIDPQTWYSPSQGPPFLQPNIASSIRTTTH